jgi:hypothetical protein
MNKIITIIVFFSIISSSRAQEPVAEKKVSLTVAEGVVVGGIVDGGGYINFTGPSIKIISKPYVIWFGVLPSLRIKEDDVPAGAKKNSLITPALGVGITFAYKHFAVQIPTYYNGKTSTSDGKWNVGLGVGYKF